MGQTQQPLVCPLCGRESDSDQRMCACGAVLEQARFGGRFDYGMLIPWIGLAGFVVAAWWIIAPGMLYYNMMPMLKLYGVVVIASTVCALLVAEDLRKHADYVTDLSPVNWFAFLLVAWPVSMPIFLRSHYERNDPARMKFGWVATGLFIAALLVLWIIVRQTPVRWMGADNDEIIIAPSAHVNRQNAGGQTPYTPANRPGAQPQAAPTSQAAPSPARQSQSASPQRHNVAPAGIPAQKNQASKNKQNRDASGNSPTSGNSYGVDMLPAP